MERLLRVIAPHFVAGAIWRGRECIQAAPILRWMIGKQPASVAIYMTRKGWKWEWL